MKKYSFNLLVILILIFEGCNKNNPVVSNNEIKLNDSFDSSVISEDSLLNRVKELSGESSIYLNDKLINIFTRYKGTEGNNNAAEYIKNKLKEYGLTVQDQTYSQYGRNIIAIQKGKDTQNYFLICAHYDSICYDFDSTKGYYTLSNIAPGADDNASGVSAVLETARVLSKYKTTYSIIYAFWDQEETTDSGSKYYADQAVKNKMNIKLVINADMLAYDNDNDGTMGLYIPNSNGLDTYINVIHAVDNLKDYKIKLKIVNRAAYSDDLTFSELGFKTMGFVEVHFDSTFTDFNNNYHFRSDKIDKFNNSFYDRVSRLIITSLANFVL